MTIVEKNKDLFAPPFCETVETFIAPIPTIKFETTNSLRIGGGWKYFNQLKLSKENYIAHNLSEFLSEWNFSHNSLSSSFIQKIFDGFKVYYIYQNFNFIKSLFLLFCLSIKSLKRKL